MIVMKARRIAILLSLACAGFLLAGCTGVSTQSSVDPMGPQARNISKLWWFQCYTLLAIFALVVVALIFAVMRGKQRRERAGEGASAEAPMIKLEPQRERSIRNVVIGATVFTVVMLFVYLFMSFITGRAISSPLNSQTALSIEVTGYQWWWAFQFQDPTSSQMFTTANEIHIPVGQPILLNMTSQDVIHSFWVPNLMGKKDLIPGKRTTLLFQADQPGVYRGQCAEYCGHQHAHMSFMIVAESPEQFQAWRNAQLFPETAPATDAQKKGEQVFLSAPCIMCHTVRGTEAASRLGPDLTHVGSRTTIAAGILRNNRENLSRWITDPQSIKPGTRMPANKLSQDDLAALVEYLGNLK